MADYIYSINEEFFDDIDSEELNNNADTDSSELIHEDKNYDSHIYFILQYEYYVNPKTNIQEYSGDYSLIEVCSILYKIFKYSFEALRCVDNVASVQFYKLGFNPEQNNKKRVLTTVNDEDIILNYSDKNEFQSHFLGVGVKYVNGIKKPKDVISFVNVLKVVNNICNHRHLTPLYMVFFENPDHMDGRTDMYNFDKLPFFNPEKYKSTGKDNKVEIHKIINALFKNHVHEVILYMGCDDDVEYIFVANHYSKSSRLLPMIHIEHEKDVLKKYLLEMIKHNYTSANAYVIVSYIDRTKDTNSSYPAFGDPNQVDKLLNDNEIGFNLYFRYERNGNISITYVTDKSFVYDDKEFVMTIGCGNTTFAMNNINKNGVTIAPLLYAGYDFNDIMKALKKRLGKEYKITEDDYDNILEVANNYIDKYCGKG